MSEAVRMKVTVVGYYDAEVEHYDGETDPVKMAAIDAEHVGENAIEAVCLAEEDTLSVRVEPA